MDNIVLKIVSSAVLGGTISEIGGGKFANGAISAAYSMLFNEMKHKFIKKRFSSWFGSNFIGPGPDCDPDDIIDENGKKLYPIDEVDAAAKEHDGAYFHAKASGINGALLNLTVASADRKLVFACSKVITKFMIMMKYNISMTDSATKQTISIKTFLRAEAVLAAFSTISVYKTDLILFKYLNPYRK